MMFFFFFFKENISSRARARKHERGKKFGVIKLSQSANHYHDTVALEAQKLSLNTRFLSLKAFTDEKIEDFVT